MNIAYIYKSVESVPDICSIEHLPLSNHLWKEQYPAAIFSCAGIFAVEGEGICVALTSDEHPVRAEYCHRDDPVYLDSCMEFFFRPFEDDERYINIEVNPYPVCLSEIGTGRHDRRLLRDVTDIAPEVSRIETVGGWGVLIFVPEQLISEAYGRAFSVSELEYIYANFYKCGEKTEAPHFYSAFEVKTATPDFHRPEYFEKIYFRLNERIENQ